jgi:hypothetical protein
MGEPEQRGEALVAEEFKFLAHPVSNRRIAEMLKPSRPVLFLPLHSVNLFCNHFIPSPSPNLIALLLYHPLLSFPFPSLPFSGVRRHHPCKLSE